MARPLRIQMAGGRHHLTARGNERRNIFRDDWDRRHLLELFSELPGRFSVRVHEWVLMDNHYHLLLETLELNLSQVGQWLNVSYSAFCLARASHRESLILVFTTTANASA